MEIVDALPTPEIDLVEGNTLMKRLWIARHDVDEKVEQLAVQ